MSLNTAHANNGVLIHSGECILLFSDNVVMEFTGNDNPVFKGKKTGRAYLTTHRMIFNNKNTNDGLQSLSFPFISLSDVEIEQPVFGGNYIRGKVRPQENGNWTGEVKFKLTFKNGGAIDYGQAMLRAASLARRNNAGGAPPPYVTPAGSWYQAPPPAYSPNPQGYYGWSPNSQAFPNGPDAGTVYMHDTPPPYPGIVPGGGQQPSYPSNPPAYGQYPQANGYPNGQPGIQQNGFQQAPYPDAAGNYPQAPYPNAAGGFAQAPYPNAAGGFAQAPYPNAAGGFGQAPYPNAAGGFAQAPYPSTGPSAPNGQGGFPGYPALPNAGQQGMMGFAQPPQQNSKEAEAAQSAYYDPNRPQTAFVPPPPAYYEPPPSYNTLNKKDQ